MKKFSNVVSYNEDLTLEILNDWDNRYQYVDELKKMKDMAGDKKVFPSFFGGTKYGEEANRMIWLSAFVAQFPGLFVGLQRFNNNNPIVSFFDGFILSVVVTFLFAGIMFFVLKHTYLTKYKVSEKDLINEKIEVLMEFIELMEARNHELMSDIMNKGYKLGGYNYRGFTSIYDKLLLYYEKYKSDEALELGVNSFLKDIKEGYDYYGNTYSHDDMKMLHVKTRDFINQGLIKV